MSSDARLPAPLHYQLEWQDFYAAVKARRPEFFTKLGRLFFWTLVIVNLLLAGFSFYLWQWQAKDMFYPFLFSTAVTIFLILYDWVFEPWFWRVYYGKLKLKNRDLVLEAMEEGFLSKADTSTSTLNWAEFTRYNRTDNHFFFWINKVQALILPIRVFDTTEERELFWEFATTRIADVHNKQKNDAVGDARP